MSIVYGDDRRAVGRILIRTPDNRWIPIPMGAGEDTKLRSFNVWDGTRWQTATWGKHVLEWNNPNYYFRTPYVAPDKPDVNALEVRAPDLTTNISTPQGYNPSFFANNDSRTWTAKQIGYFRLTHLAPRVDPHWRIVQIFDPLPANTPSGGPPGFSGTTGILWGVGARRNLTYIESYTSPPYTDETVEGMQPEWVPANRRSDQILVNLTQSVGKSLVDPNANPAPQWSTYLTITTIDLKALRQRLHNEFAQRSVDYQGQYDNIDNMKVKRILINAVVTMRIGFQANSSGLMSWFDTPRTRVYIAKNAPTTPIPAYQPTGDFAYTPRAANSTDVHGDKVFEAVGAHVGDTYFSPSNTYVSRQQINQLRMTIDDNPGEESTYTFYLTVDDFFVPDGVNVFFTNVQAQITQTSLSVQYATDGHDVPVAYREEASIRGDSA